MTRVYTRDEIVKALSQADIIRAIEAGFVAYSNGEAIVPPAVHLGFEQPPGDCHIKCACLRGDPIFVVKIATGFYQNPKRGLPSSNGVILVFSSHTGELAAILQDEGLLTDVRTAAAGAVAAKYLASSCIDYIGIVGAGTQAHLQLEYLKEVTSCRRAIVWARNAERAEGFRVEGFAIEVAATLEELASKSRLIVTTTPSREWLVSANDVRPGTHITAVGADGGGKQELEPMLFALASVCAVDSQNQCMEFGDSSYALKAGLVTAESLIELGRIILDPKLGRRDQNAITIADLTGVAVQDIQIAKLALNRMESGSKA